MNDTARDAVGTHARIVLLAGSCFTLLAGAAVSPALPGIREQFIDAPNIDLLSRQVLAITPLFIAIGGLIAGPIADRFGRKRLLVVSIIATGIIGTSGYLMDSIYTLLATRVGLGLAVGGVMTACTTLIGDYFTDQERQRFFGYQSAAMKFGGMVFLLAGGVLAAISWRHPFLVDLLAFLIVPGALLAIHEPVRARVTPTVTQLREDWRELGRFAPLLVYTLGFAGQILFFMVPTQLPFLISAELRGSPQMVGVAIALSTLASAIVASQYHRIRGRLAPGHVFVLVFVLKGVAFIGVYAATSYVGVLAAMLVLGIGMGMMLPNLSVVLLDSVSARVRGRAAGFLTAAQTTGQFASPILLAPLIGVMGLGMSFALMGGVSLLIAFWLLFVRTPAAGTAVSGAIATRR